MGEAPSSLLLAVVSGALRSRLSAPFSDPAGPRRFLSSLSIIESYASIYDAMKKEEKRAQKRLSRRMKKGERQKLKKGVKTRHSERLLPPFKSDGKSERRAKEPRKRTGNEW